MLRSSKSPFLLLIGLALVAGGVVAWIETAALDLGLWAAYAFLILVGEGLLYLAWRVVKRDGADKKLFTFALIGLFLRIGVGVALYQGLPRWGYDEKAQRAGYVYWDAYKRDTDAYARARSDQPLLTAFTTPKPSDQYGGVLVLSSLIYRHIGLPGHHPLLITTFFASISLLTVIFTWGFLKRVFDERIAWVGALISMLYPEAILLSASQMREPFLMSAVALALYGYSFLRTGQFRSGLLLSLLAVGVSDFPHFTTDSANLASPLGSGVGLGKEGAATLHWGNHFGGTHHCWYSIDGQRQGLGSLGRRGRIHSRGDASLAGECDSPMAYHARFRPVGPPGCHS